jgi:hypothetical protein
MEDKAKQLQTYECMLKITAVPLAERGQILRGAELFFTRGWPNNHFTIAMAVRAARGLVPPAYEGLGSEGRYFQVSKARTRRSRRITLNVKVAPASQGSNV